VDAGGDRSGKGWLCRRGFVARVCGGDPTAENNLGPLADVVRGRRKLSAGRRARVGPIIFHVREVDSVPCFSVR